MATIMKICPACHGTGRGHPTYHAGTEFTEDTRCERCYGEGHLGEPWSMEELPIPELSPEEKQRQAARMADLICQLIKEMGGLPSTAHGVAAALCKALEDRKG